MAGVALTILGELDDDTVVVLVNLVVNSMQLVLLTYIYARWGRNS